jgi:hypothetical protein
LLFFKIIKGRNEMKYVICVCNHGTGRYELRYNGPVHSWFFCEEEIQKETKDEDSCEFKIFPVGLNPVVLGGDMKPA